MQSSAFYKKLLGELIGVVRAVDGSEHLIRPATDALLRRVLAAAQEPGTDAVVLGGLMRQVLEEKQAIVPGCFACAAPCGRTAAYDLERLEDASVDVRAIKDRLLEGLFAAAKNDAFPVRALYPPLFAIGLEDVSAAELQPFADELEAVLAQAQAAE